MVIGVDFGGTSVKVAAARGAELLSGIIRIPTQDHEGADRLIEAIVERVGGLREEFPEIRALGVGVPGAIDFERGVTYNLTNVSGWSSVPLRDILAEKTGLPTVVENDANCMAYAEWRHGSARGSRNAVCVTLGTGVGGGLVLDGKLFRGSQFAAGEIGQMSIDFQGVQGPYGNTGALERYIGNRQISEAAEKAYREAGAEIPGDLTPESLARLAEGGDEVATGVWRWVADCLGSSLMNCVYLLNPDAIVVGGGVAAAGEVLFGPLRDRLRQSLTPECFDHLGIRPATFGNTAGIIGSAALAAELR